MDEKKKKILSKWLVRIVIFFVLAIILWLCFKLIKPSLIEILSNFSNLKNKTSKLSNIISYIFGIFDMIISIIITAVIHSKIEKRQDLPKIKIIPNQVHGRNISGVKKEKNINYTPRIEVGEKQIKYRIVFAKIINTGKNSITECSIEEQVISFLLTPNDETPIYFILYGHEEGKAVNYELKYLVQDTKNNSYKGTYCMQLDIEKGVASFWVQKTKGVLNNAL